MNPVEWHQFLTGLIREGPGMVAAAVIAFIAGVIACRWWVLAESKKRFQELRLKNEYTLELNQELMRKLGRAQQELGSVRGRVNAHY